MLGMAEDLSGLDRMWDGIERVGPRIQLALVQVGQQAVASGGAGDGFRIDPERAQACIDALLVVAGDLRRSLSTLLTFWFEPPGLDEVSINMTRNASEMALRARAYVAAWANQIEATAEALRQQLEAYRRVDETNAAQRV